MAFSLSVQLVPGRLMKAQVVARAVNRTAENVRSTLISAIADNSGLAVSKVRAGFRIESASADSLEARIYADGNPVPLIEYGASGPEPSRGKGQGVTSRLRGGAGRYPHAFLASMRSGHRGIFQRVGRARLPIRELRGPSIWFLGTKFVKDAEARAREQFPKNLDAQEAFADLAA